MNREFLSCHRLKLQLTAVLAAIVVMPLSAAAQYPYNSVIAFGDSLLDNGNLFALSGNALSMSQTQWIVRPARPKRQSSG